MDPMRRKTSPWMALLIVFLCAIQTTLVSGKRLIESNSLSDCLPKDANRTTDGFVPSLFKVRFTPDDGVLAFDIVGVSSIVGKIEAKMQLIAYGLTAMEQTMDACDPKLNLMQMCPMAEGNIDLNSTQKFSKDVVDKIPGTYS
jgi:hypothetical protein